MTHRSNKENISALCQPKKASRTRIVSRKLAESTNDAAAALKVKLMQKTRSHVRARKRADARTAREIVEEMDDSEEVRQLKARAHRAEAERDALSHKLFHRDAPTATASTTETAVDSIPRPAHVSKITVASIRELLGLEGEDHKSEWLTIRNTVRDTMMAVRLDWKDNWKGQSSRKLVKLYDVVEEAIPLLRCFKHQWGVEHLAKEVFSARKSYARCKDDPHTYRGKLKARKRHDTGRSDSHPQTECRPDDSDDHQDDYHPPRADDGQDDFRPPRADDGQDDRHPPASVPGPECNSPLPPLTDDEDL